MSEQQIDYERLSQEALRGVVRSVLERVAQSGLPGNHYFYIAFNTQADGVGISKRLKVQYPEEMTIVLQHRFWDLAVHEDRFEVKLTFNSIPERLVVPFQSLKVFFDPSVHYGMQFEPSELSAAARKGPRLAEVKTGFEGETEAGGQDDRAPAADPEKKTPIRNVGAARPRLSRKGQSDRVASPPPVPELSQSTAKSPDGPDDDPPRPSAEVVKLDRFRKK